MRRLQPYLGPAEIIRGDFDHLLGFIDPAYQRANVAHPALSSTMH